MLNVSSLNITSVVKAAALALAVSLPVAAATATPASAAETSRTTAYSFAEGLGGGQKVAFAEDGVPMRHVENLGILISEFRSNYGGLPLPVVVRGLADANRDGLDDDGKLSIALFAAGACLKLSATSYTVADGSCTVTTATTAPSRQLQSARSVVHATKWHVASENAWAAQGMGVRQAARSVKAIREALSEVRPGVTVRGLVDRDKNGVDDDGKLLFTSSTGSVCLTLSRTGGAPVLKTGAC